MPSDRKTSKDRPPLLRKGSTAEDDLDEEGDEDESLSRKRPAAKHDKGTVDAGEPLFDISIKYRVGNFNDTRSKFQRVMKTTLEGFYYVKPNWQRKSDALYTEFKESEDVKTYEYASKRDAVDLATKDLIDKVDKIGKWPLGRTEELVAKEAAVRSAVAVLKRKAAVFEEIHAELKKLKTKANTSNASEKRRVSMRRDRLKLTLVSSCPDALAQTFAWKLDDFGIAWGPAVTCLPSGHCRSSAYYSVSNMTLCQVRFILLHMHLPQMWCTGVVGHVGASDSVDGGLLLRPGQFRRRPCPRLRRRPSPAAC